MLGGRMPCEREQNSEAAKAVNTSILGFQLPEL